MRTLQICELTNVAGGSSVIPTSKNSVMAPGAAGTSGKTYTIVPPPVDISNKYVGDVKVSDLLQEIAFMFGGEDEAIAAKYPWFKEYTE